jgi:hypothetical protein
MYGERSTVIEAPESITTMVTFASVTSGAMLSADGVMPTPMTATLSFTIISRAARFA